MKVYTIPCYDRGHINVMLVLQSCTDPLRVMAGSSSETFPSSSDGTCDVGNIKVEEDLDIKGEEEMNMPDFEEDTYMPNFEEVNVKTEKVIFSDEEECIDIKDEVGLYTEEEEEEEDIDTKEEEDVNIKEEVSLKHTVYRGKE